MCGPGPFCERPHRCSQLGDKVEKQKPPTPSRYSKVSDGGGLGVTKFFLGGWVAGGDFGTFGAILKLFLKIILPLPTSCGLCGEAQKSQNWIPAVSCRMVGEGATRANGKSFPPPTVCFAVSFAQAPSVPREGPGTNRIDLCFDGGFSLIWIFFWFFVLLLHATAHTHADGIFTSLNLPWPATPIWTSPEASVAR